MKKGIALILVNLLAGIIPAQQVTLSEDEKSEFILRARQRIEDLQMYLGTIASKAGVSEACKDAATASVLELFIGKGGTYEYTNIDGMRLTHGAVKVVFTELSGKQSVRSFKRYLKMLKNGISKDLEIESVDIIIPDSIYVRDGKYEAIVCYMQKFCRNKDGRILFQDVTNKKMKLLIEKEVINLSNGEEQTIWPVFLGDIYVKER